MEKINFVNNSQPYINADNLNGMQDNVENAIADAVTDVNENIDTAQQEILEYFNYSTTEKQIGKWINDKPLYRKVISMGNLLNSNSLIVAHGISNIEFISNAIMFAIRESDSDRLPVPYATFNANNSGGLNGYANVTNVVITTSSDRTAYKGYAILEYTKTTD